ncbi:MAG: hypothetical protein AVDCRST_MAG90-336 [uncultured Microvirga sp.]|uniref:Uncharacterized protein n=1 Tax=uncultured Microvirga sp. TaxID=412392 RepID=A0A6J4KMQ4_9HYPH|nr:MAG: hypothetical protein AVDCRST_MAG90-336 [uncultured Microvirga sp.]
MVGFEFSIPMANRLRGSGRSLPTLSRSSRPTPLGARRSRARVLRFLGGARPMMRQALRAMRVMEHAGQVAAPGTDAGCSVLPRRGQHPD